MQLSLVTGSAVSAAEAALLASFRQWLCASRSTNTASSYVCALKKLVQCPVDFSISAHRNLLELSSDELSSIRRSRANKDGHGACNAAMAKLAEFARRPPLAPAAAGAAGAVLDDKPGPPPHGTKRKRKQDPPPRPTSTQPSACSQQSDGSQPEVIEPEGELQRPKRYQRGVKLEQEDAAAGMLRCPSCQSGIFAAGGCNITTCRAKHGASGRWHRFCCHCKQDLGDGNLCVNCKFSTSS